MEVLVGQLSDAVVFVDPAGRVLLANQEKLGRRSHAVPNGDDDNPFQIFRPDGRRYESGDWPVLRSIATGEVILDEKFFRLAPDGRRHTFSCRCAPVYGQDGEIVAVVFVERETTKGRRAQEELIYLRQMLERSEDAVIFLDSRSRVTSWNDAASRIYGWSSHRARRRYLPGLLKLDLGDEHTAEVRRLLRERGEWSGRLIVQRQDGSPVSISLSRVAVRDEDGEISGYVDIHRDLTERNRTAAELQNATARTEDVLDRVSDAFFAVDGEWRYTYLNRQAVTQAGRALGREVTANELLGQDCWEVFAEWAGTPFHDAFRRAMTTQTPLQVEGYVPRADSWFHVCLYPSATGLSIYLFDLTERRRSQQDLERRIGQQAAVAELGVAALQNGAVGSLMEEAVTLLCRELGVEYAAVAELLPNGNELLVVSGAGWGEGVVGHLTMPSGRGSPEGFAVVSGSPVIVDDMASETRFEVPEVLLPHGARSEIIVVIDQHGTPFGTLAALSRRQRSFSEHDIGFVQSVANVLATALERAEAELRLEQAREAERGRVARDLHDEALRELSDALAMAAVTRSAAGEEGDEQRWGTMISALQRVGQQLRGAIYDLRLSADEQRPFADLLAELVSVQAGLTFGGQVELVGRDALGAGSLGHSGTELLRIIREAITNARLHSGATTVRVEAGGSDRRVVRIAVIDDGSWPDRDVAVRGRRGSGIRGMFDRAEGIRARLRIESSPGGGTRMAVVLELGAGGGMDEG
ncbi:MAG TPA: PAS domain-containing protein [Solirubrobacteraceae bacterium]|nr:PAS domain-containing protein [Solirubrobacteraceae bacterium]